MLFLDIACNEFQPISKCYETENIKLLQLLKYISVSIGTSQATKTHDLQVRLTNVKSRVCIQQTQLRNIRNFLNSAFNVKVLFKNSQPTIRPHKSTICQECVMHLCFHPMPFLLQQSIQNQFPLMDMPY